MPSVRIIYGVDGCAYHHDAAALQRYAPADFDVSIAPFRDDGDADAALGSDPVDLILLLRKSKMPALVDALRRRRSDRKLVVRWSSDFPRQLGLFYSLRGAADAWIFSNAECWRRSGRLLRTYMVPNGVDLNIFSVQRPLAERRPKILWVGSEKHRRLKGYDDFMLPLQDRLRAQGIDCELLLVDSYGSHKRAPREMAEWYNTGTVLVCASENEGTPNPALEAAACGCTIVSTKVGNMPELIRDDVNGYLVDRDVEPVPHHLRGGAAAVRRRVRRGERPQRRPGVLGALLARVRREVGHLRVVPADALHRGGDGVECGVAFDVLVGDRVDGGVRGSGHGTSCGVEAMIRPACCRGAGCPK